MEADAGPCHTRCHSRRGAESLDEKGVAGSYDMGWGCAGTYDQNAFVTERLQRLPPPPRITSHIHMSS